MQLFANNADSSLNGAIAPDTLVLTLKTGEGAKFPSPSNGDYFLVTIFQKIGATELNHEIVKCTSRAGDNLTVVRAQEGTSAKPFNSGDLVELRVTKGTVENFAQPENLATKEPVITASSFAPTEKYWRGDKMWRDFFTDVRSATLTGLSTATNAAVAATDTVLAAIGKLQAQVASKLDKTGGDISGNVNLPSLNGGQLAGFRNKIINGNFDVWQRGTGVTGAGYGADRWTCYLLLGSTFQQGQRKLTDAERAIVGFDTQYALALTADTATSAVALQKVEGVRTLAGKQVTLSFYAWTNTGTASITATLDQVFGTGGSPSAIVSSGALFLSQSTVGTTPTKITATFTLASISGKTLGTNGGDNLSIQIIKNAGSANSLYITQIQLEPGPVATPFEHRPYGLELALCQRYYYRLTPSANRAFGFGYAATSNIVSAVVPLPPMRVGPTAIEQSGTAGDYSVAYSGATQACSVVPVIAGASSSAQLVINAQFATPITAGQGAYVYATNANAYIGVSAEV